MTFDVTQSADGLQRATLAALCLKLVLLLCLAFNTQFVMDEFWQLGQSKYLGAGFFDTVWPAKAVGYAVFYTPAHWLGWDAASTLLIGRLQTALLAFGTLWLLFGIARHIGHDRMRALLVILLAVSFSTFMERIFRTRSEPLALFFATAALYWIVSRPTFNVRTALIAGCFCGLSFLATQKAVYFNVSLGLALTVVAFLRNGVTSAFTLGSTLLAGWLLPVLVYGVAFGGLNPTPILSSLIAGPVAVATSGQIYYENLGAFFIQTFERNVLPYLLGACGLVIGLLKWRSLSAVQQIALIFTLSMVILIGRHNQPWPYVFIMVIPFLALWAPATLDLKSARLPVTKLVAALWIIAVVFGFARNVTYLQNDNRAALDTIRQAESLLAPGETYFDGMGMLPNFYESQRRWLDARQVHIANTEGDQSDIMQKLRATPPHLIIDNYRIYNLTDLLKPFLEHSYVRVAPNILMPGVRLRESGDTEFVVPLAQEFAVYDQSGKPAEVTIRVDGNLITGPIRLTPGTSRIGIATDTRAEGPFFLLPAGKSFSRLDPAPKPVALFFGVYIL